MTATAQSAAAPTAVIGTIYTCPMHPTVRQGHPGNCPICGMVLEPEQPTLDDVENPELSDFRRRFVWTLPLTLSVAVLGMAGEHLSWIPLMWLSRIELALTLPIVLWAGKPFFERAVESLIHFSPNMWTLIGLGTFASFSYSVVATVAPGVFPSSLSCTVEWLSISRPLQPSFR